MPHYLLVMGCSQKKDASPSPMKALDRYEGVNFKVLKKFRKEKKMPDNLDIVIISAKYGFIEADDYIDDYDLRMDKKRAFELHGQVLNDLKELLSTKNYEEIFINLGKDYLPALEGIENAVTCPVTYAEGRIGEKMKAMKNWIIKISLSKGQKTLDEVL